MEKISGPTQRKSLALLVESGQVEKLGRGLDVALEALRALVREPGFVADELLRYCRICRVEKVVTPYLEALL